MEGESQNTTESTESLPEVEHAENASPDKPHFSIDISKVLADLEGNIASITEQSVVEILEGMWEKVRGFHGIAGFKGKLAQLTIKSMGWSMTVFDKLGIGVNDPDRALRTSETYLRMVSGYKPGRHAADNHVELPEVRESEEPIKKAAITQIMIEHLLVERQRLRRMNRIESTVADVLEQLTTISPDDNNILTEWKQELSNQLQRKYPKKYTQQVIQEMFESETWKTIFPEYEELPQLLSTVPAILISRKLLNCMLSTQDRESISSMEEKSTSEDILKICKNVNVPVKDFVEKIIPAISTNLQLIELLTQLYEKEKEPFLSIRRLCENIASIAKGVPQNIISVEEVLREINRLLGDVAVAEEQKVSIALQMVAIVYKKTPHLFPGIAKSPQAAKIITEALLQEYDKTHDFFEATTDLTVKECWNKETTDIMRIKKQLTSNLVIITNGQAYRIPSYVVVNETGELVEITEEDLINYKNFRILPDGQIELFPDVLTNHSLDHAAETLSQKRIFTPISSVMNGQYCAEILQIFSEQKADTSLPKLEFGEDFVDALKLYNHLNFNDMKKIDKILENTLGIFNLDGFDEFCLDLETSNPSVPVVLMWDSSLQMLRASYNHLIQDGVLGALAANQLKTSLEKNLLVRMRSIPDLKPLPTIEQSETKSRSILGGIIRLFKRKQKKEITPLCKQPIEESKHQQEKKITPLCEQLTEESISIHDLLEGNIAPPEGIGRIKLNRAKFKQLVLAINIYAGKDNFSDVTSQTLFSYLGGLLRSLDVSDIFNSWKSTNRLAECAQKASEQNMNELGLPPASQMKESLERDKLITEISEKFGIKLPKVGTDNVRIKGERIVSMDSVINTLSKGKTLTKKEVVVLLARSAHLLTISENLIEAYLKHSIPLADAPLAGSATTTTGRIIPVVIRELKFPDVKGWLERIRTLSKNASSEESQKEVDNLKTATATSMRATSTLFKLGRKYAGKGDWVSQAALHVVSNLGRLGTIVQKIAMSELTGKVARIVAATVGTQSNTVHPIERLWTSRLVEQEPVTPVQMSMNRNTNVGNPENVITLRLSMHDLRNAASFAKSYLKGQLLLSHAHRLLTEGNGDHVKFQKGLTELATFIDSQKGRRILSSLTYRFLLKLSNGMAETILNLMEKDFETMCDMFITPEQTPSN